MVLGVELLPSENFTLRVGYNYQRRQELKFDEKNVDSWLYFWLRIQNFPFRTELWISPIPSGSSFQPFFPGY